MMLVTVTFYGTRQIPGITYMDIKAHRGKHGIAARAHAQMRRRTRTIQAPAIRKQTTARGYAMPDTICRAAAAYSANPFIIARATTTDIHAPPRKAINIILTAGHIQ